MTSVTSLFMACFNDANPEAEPVVLERDGDSITLTLDDGTAFQFLLSEFLAAAREERKAA